MKKTLKVIVLGDVSVGKTTLMQRYVRGISTQNYRPTIGVDVHLKDVQVFDGKRVSAIIWDTAGMERHDGLLAGYYRGADCCVLVFDVTQPATFDSLERWKTKFLRDADVHDPDNFPFVVVGNKTDLGEDRMDFKRVIRWCQLKGGLTYFHASAINGTMVEHAFQKIVEYADGGGSLGLVFKRVIRWYQLKGGLTYFHTSAINGTMVEHAFQKIVEYAYEYETKNHVQHYDCYKADKIIISEPRTKNKRLHSKCL